MVHFKRTFSALLAVVMVFTTFSVALTVVSSAAVDRIPTSNPQVILTVPQYLQSQGDSPAKRGRKILGGGSIMLRVPGGAENFDVSCNVSGITVDGPVTNGDRYTWTVQEGLLPTDPTSVTTVKWTITYRSSTDGQLYTTYAWSSVRLNYNNPGLASDLVMEYTWGAYDSYNQHVQECMPVNGTSLTAPSSEYTLCYPDVSSFNYGTDPGYGMETATYWYNHGYSGGSKSVESAAGAGGVMYADVSQVSDLADFGLQIRAGRASYAIHDDEGETHHKDWYDGASFVSQSIANGSSQNFYIVNDDTGPKGDGEVGYSTLHGSLIENVTPGDEIVIKPKAEWESQSAKVIGIGSKVALECFQAYTIRIYTYDKSDLKAALDTANMHNYQQKQMCASKPDDLSDPTGKFRTWSQYMTALETAWTIYGREAVTQQQINNAAANLRACFAQYSEDNNKIWLSGMKYTDADYTACDAIDETIPEDFFITYPDGTNGKYYKWSGASVLNAARADIASDYGQLDSRYQGVVNQMKANLNDAINTLSEAGYKDAQLHFDGNAENVNNLPVDTQSKLYGRAYAPTNVPTRQYYTFSGWYYDQAATQSVTWPVTILPTSPYFCGNLNTKGDSAGVSVIVYAGWTFSGKTLTFDSMGGSSIPQVIGAAGDAFTPTDAHVPTKAGYVFDYWCTDSTLQTPVDWSTFTLGKYATVYARYHEASVYVTFDANGGVYPNGGSTVSVGGTYGDQVTVPKILPTRSGYAFGGWGFTSTTAWNDATLLDDYTFPTSNQRVYAVWSTDYCNYFVDNNDGSVPEMFIKQKNKRINQPTNPPARAGYNFSGYWYLDPELTEKVTWPYTITSNVTFYAKWNPKKATLMFDANGGVMPTNYNQEDYVNLIVGSALNFPDPPTKEGYLFVGWSEVQDGTESDVIPYNTVPTTSMTLYAVWILEPYIARFRLGTDAQGTSVKRSQIVNVSVYMSANFIVSSNSFIVYYDNRYFVPAKNGVEFTTRTVGAGAVTKSANGDAPIKVVRNQGGNVTDCGTLAGRVNTGAEAATQYFPTGWAKSTSELNPEYSMYSYVYFSASDSPTGSRMMPKNEQTIATFQLKVKDNAPLVDGNENYASIFMIPEYNKTANSQYGRLMACRETQTAWDGEAYYDCDYTVADAEYKFAVEEQEKVQVSFNTKGGSNMPPVQVAIGSNYTPETPTQTGYTFLGWSLTDSDDATTFKTFEVPDHNVVLYAHWQGNMVNYTVAHHFQNLSGGYDLETQTIQGRVGTIVYATPKSRAGFMEPDSDFGVVSADTSNPLRLELWYDRKETQVTLDANGGYFGNDESVSSVALPRGMYGTTLTNTFANPVREGHEFNGWKYNNATYTFSTYPADDISVSASWKAKTYTIYFYLNGEYYGAITKQYGAEISAPTVDVGEDQMFTGWVAATTGEPFNYTTMPADPISRFNGTRRSSKMTVTCSILTKVNGIYTVTDTFTALSEPEGTVVNESMLGYTLPEGYQSVQWRVGNTETSTLVSFPMILTDDVTIYGFLKPKDITITMMFSAFGEPYEWYAEMTGKYGDSYEREPDPDYPDDLYGFKAWYTDAELTQPYEWPDTLPANDVTVYGMLYELEGKITFNANATDCQGEPPADISAVLGTTVDIPGAGTLTRPFYKFGGWAKSKNSQTAVQQITITNTSTLNLYAIWTVNYATINYDMNGATAGTQPANRRVVLNEALTEFPDGADFVRDGFLFLGWATTSNAKEPIDSYTATTTGAKTLYAVWAALSVDLVAAEGSTTVIDNENMIIYGLCERATVATLLSDYLAVEGNGHLVFNDGGMVIGENDGVLVGTGTQVELVNDYSGNTDAVYTIIIIGDINGDGEINNNDLTSLKSFVYGTPEPEQGSATFFAADVNGDGEVNNTDITPMKAVVFGSSTFDQATRNLIG